MGEYREGEKVRESALGLTVILVHGIYPKNEINPRSEQWENMSTGNLTQSNLETTEMSAMGDILNNNWW